MAQFQNLIRCQSCIYKTKQLVQTLFLILGKNYEMLFENPPEQSLIFPGFQRKALRTFLSSFLSEYQNFFS